MERRLIAGQSRCIGTAASEPRPGSPERAPAAARRPASSKAASTTRVWYSTWRPTGIQCAPQPSR